MCFKPCFPYCKIPSVHLIGSSECALSHVFRTVNSHKPPVLLNESRKKKNVCRLSVISKCVSKRRRGAVRVAEVKGGSTTTTPTLLLSLHWTPDSYIL